MKHALNLFASALMILLVGQLPAQINIQERLERKAKERLERKVDHTIDKGFDKTEEEVDKEAREATKGKGKKDKDKEAEAGGAAEGGAAGEGKTDGAAAGDAAPRTLKAYSKFDFVPGEQVVAVEDFMQDAIGDFPAKWNTNSAGEVVMIDGKEGRWFKLNGTGLFYPEFLGVIPDNTTVEFDLAVLGEYSYYCRCLEMHFKHDAENLFRHEPRSLVSVNIHPQTAGGSEGSTAIAVHAADGGPLLSNDRGQSQFVHKGVAPFVHVALWRQKNRLRLYLNEEKVWDIPRAFQNDVNYRLVFETGSCDESIPYMANLRVAVGAPDTRNKLITEGRLVTRGILFDSGSDRIKPESYGTLKDIATVLAENAAVRVRIIGHTDSDGEDAANMDLSKRRAAAVREALNKEFAIDAARMETDGKGEASPAGPNDTPQGKANNRRVEFVKL